MKTITHTMRNAYLWFVLAALATIAFEPWHIDILNRVAYYSYIASSLLIAILYFIGLFRGCFLEKTYVLFSVICLSLIIILSTLQHPKLVMNTDYLFSVGGFFFFIVMIIAQDAIPIDRKMIDSILKLGVVLSVILIFYSFFPFAFSDLSYGMNNLVLGFENPNTTGMMLFSCLSIVLIAVRTIKRKGLLLCIVLCLLILIYLTNSRSSFVAALILCLFHFKRSHKPIFKGFMIFIVLIPIIYVSVLIIMHEQKMLQDFAFMGKPMYTGRERIYENLIRRQSGAMEVIFGRLTSHQLANAHNGPLAIYISLGIAGLSLYYTIILTKLVQYNKRCNSNTQRSALICILMIFIQASAEAAFFTGCIPFGATTLILFLLARDEEKDSFGDIVYGEINICLDSKKKRTPAIYFNNMER